MTPQDIPQIEALLADHRFQMRASTVFPLRAERIESNDTSLVVTLTLVGERYLGVHLARDSAPPRAPEVVASDQVTSLEELRLLLETRLDAA